jgi:diacylglycerol kinase family enzyme
VTPTSPSFFPLQYHKEKQHLFIVLNPQSGREDAHIKEKILTTLTKADYEFTYCEETTGHAITEAVTNAIQAGATLIVAVGGDGTISAAAQPLINTNHPLVIIPAGTNNALAHSFKIRSIPFALQALGHHSTQVTMDAIKVNETYCLLSVSSGVSSLTMQSHKRRKSILGSFSYILWGLYHLIKLNEHNFSLLIDETLFKVKAHEVFINNIRRSSLTGILLRQSQPDDGVIECYILRPNDLIESIFTQPLVEFHAITHSFSIRTSHNLQFQLDGEPFQSQCVDGEVVPQALNLRIPLYR